MKIILTTIISIIILSIQTTIAQPQIDGLKMITEEALKAQTNFLASDWTEGRETGERGAYMSADYIASMLQLFGAKPAGDMVFNRDPESGKAIMSKSYFQNFNLITTTPGESQELTISIIDGKTVKKISFLYFTDFTINASDPGVEIEAPVVFVGYGYKNSKSGYNDFKDIDVKGKIILRLSGYPPSESGDSSPYANYRAASAKDAIAAGLGVAGVLEVDPSNIDGGIWAPQKKFMNMAPSEQRMSRPRVRYSIPGSKAAIPMPRANVTVKVANTILNGYDFTISDYTGGKVGNLNNVKDIGNMVTLKTTVVTKVVKVRNVLGVIEGKKRDEVIILGAHYDHLGMFNGYINNGADDNASGTVGVLTIARAFFATGIQPEKTIIFALWTGEEKGLLGSRYYVDNPTVPLENIRLNVNFDMISRYISDTEPNKVTMTYSDSCMEFKDITLKNIKKYSIELDPDFQPSDNPPGGSDHRSFVAKKIPIMRFKPGHREEYHTPLDEVSTLNWDIMEKIVRISFLNVWELATSDW